MNYERFKKEMAVLMIALDTEMQKPQPMPRYLLEKIEAMERAVRVLKSQIDY